MWENYGGFGAERQSEIYRLGSSGRKPDLPLAPEALELGARDKLTPEAFDYVAGGAGSEDTVRANLAAFRRWQLVPRLLVDVARRDTRIELLGHRLPAPVLFAPVGALSIVHPQGELAAARAAASLGLPFILSTLSSHSLEEVATVMGSSTRWFQLYWGPDREVNTSLVTRAEAAGYSAIVLTPDTKILGWRERDLQRGYVPFLAGAGVANHLSDPVFLRTLDKPPEVDPQGAILRAAKSLLDPSFDWEDLQFLREKTKLPILVKGVLRPADAEKAIDAGAAGVVVSNHGGRQVDGSVASLTVLPEVVARVGDRVPVLLDSGIRRGADVIKAIGLGARAVLFGRPYVWGLALKGENGVREVVENLLADLDLTLASSGLRAIAEVDSDLLRPCEEPPMRPGTGSL